MSRENGNPLNFKEFQTFLFTTRRAISNRILLSQSALVSTSDLLGLTGQVAHTSHISGFQDGKNIHITVVAVVKVRLEKGERKIEMESFVLESDLQPIPAKTIMATKAQISNLFHDILIQDQEDIFNISYERGWSKTVVEK